MLSCVDTRSLNHQSRRNGGLLFLLGVCIWGKCMACTCVGDAGVGFGRPHRVVHCIPLCSALPNIASKHIFSVLLGDDDQKTQ
jgi:hypothetical protein